MKLAFLLTGHIRENCITIDSLKENIDYALTEFGKDEVDFFATTWYSDSTDYQALRQKFDIKILDIETENEYASLLREWTKEYQYFLMNYTNDDPGYLAYSDPHFQNHIRPDLSLGSINVVYKPFRGIRLINEYGLKNGIQYDAIIRSRWDAKILEPISREHMEEVRDFDNFYANSVSYVDDNDWARYQIGWVDDSFYYANPKTMTGVIGGLWRSLPQIWKNHNTWIPHIWIKEYIRENGIPHYDTETKIMLMRPNGVWNVLRFYFKNPEDRKRFKR